MPLLKPEQISTTGADIVMKPSEGVLSQKFFPLTFGEHCP